jgi:hypothetical protein
MQQLFKLLDQEVQRAAALQAFFENFVAVVGDPGFQRMPIILLVARPEDADEFGAVRVLKGNGALTTFFATPRRLPSPFKSTKCIDSASK